jgi:hypothetical protein
LNQLAAPQLIGDSIKILDVRLQKYKLKNHKGLGHGITKHTTNFFIK